MSRPAAIYCRISQAPDGSLLGVDRQEPPCRALAARKGWTVVEVFVDNDLSASRFARKPRPQYARMLEAARNGEVTAIAVLEADRLTRRPAENEQVISLAEEHGIALATVAGEIDLATASGRLQFRMLGNIAAHESELKSERVKRKMEQLALAGEDGGGVRAFGRAADRMALHPVEAPLVQQAVERLLAGGTLKAVVADWNAAGITTTRGKPWGPTSLRRMLLQPRLYGARTYLGQVVVADAYPPVVPRERWEALRALLTDPSRSKGAPTRYLLSGIAACYACEVGLVGDPQRGRPFYGCRGQRRGCGKVVVSAKDLDAIVSEAVLERLSGPGLERARQALAAADPDYRRLAERRQADERALGELAHARFVERSIDHRDYLVTRVELESRLTATQRTLGRKARGGILSKLPEGPEALRAEWARHADDLDWRRAVIVATLERVVVGPGRPQRFDRARVLPPYGPVWRVPDRP
jgi:site-specific DNA recombinase